MPHASVKPSGGRGGGGGGGGGGDDDDFGSADEVKVYKEEGEAEEEINKSFVENLSEEKIGLVTETEQGKLGDVDHGGRGSVGGSGGVDRGYFPYSAHKALGGLKPAKIPDYGPFGGSSSGRFPLGYPFLSSYPPPPPPGAYPGTSNVLSAAGIGCGPFLPPGPWFYMYNNDLVQQAPSHVSFPALHYASASRHPGLAQPSYPFPSHPFYSTDFQSLEQFSRTSSHPTYSPLPSFSPSHYLPSPFCNSRFVPSDYFPPHPMGFSYPGISHPKLVSMCPPTGPEDSFSSRHSVEGYSEDSSLFLSLPRRRDPDLALHSTRHRSPSDRPRARSSHNEHPLFHRQQQQQQLFHPNQQPRRQQQLHSSSRSSSSVHGSSSSAAAALGSAGILMSGAPLRRSLPSMSSCGSHIKKPLNAFMLFMKEMRPKIMDECTLKESAAINQILGRRWHSLERAEQARYYDLARKEKQLHKQRFPGWSARDNYATQARKRRRAAAREQFHRREMSFMGGGLGRGGGGVGGGEAGGGVNGMIDRKSSAADIDRDSRNAKKCRARYGLDHQNRWCKPCRRKKRCIRFLDDADFNNTSSRQDSRHDGRHDSRHDSRQDDSSPNVIPMADSTSESHLLNFMSPSATSSSVLDDTGYVTSRRHHDVTSHPTSSSLLSPSVRGGNSSDQSTTPPPPTTTTSNRSIFDQKLSSPPSISRIARHRDSPSRPQQNGLGSPPNFNESGSGSMSSVFEGNFSKSFSEQPLFNSFHPASPFRQNSHTTLDRAGLAVSGVHDSGSAARQWYINEEYRTESYSLDHSKNGGLDKSVVTGGMDKSVVTGKGFKLMPPPLFSGKNGTISSLSSSLSSSLMRTSP